MTELCTHAVVAVLRVSDREVPIYEGETLLDALRRNGVWVPFECGWGSCSTCKAALVSGAVRYRLDPPPALRPHDQRMNRIVLCQAVPVTAEVEIRPLSVADTPQPHLATVDVEGMLAEREWFTDDLFILRVQLSRPIRYLPGQYAILEVDGVRRCYSMLNPAADTGTQTIELLVRVKPDGAVTPRLATVPCGTRLCLQVPYGGAYLRPARRYLLVAGGTGIAPMLAIVRALAAARQPVPVQLIYGAATPAHLAFHGELEELLHHLGGSLTITVDRATEGWDGLTGPVTIHLDSDQLAAEAADLRCYIAGPPRMVKAVQRIVSEAGIPANRVHADAFA
jgi:toluene monooxygenase electron transfer component